MYRVGVDIGATKIMVGILNDEKIIALKKLFVKDITDIYETIKGCIDELCRENGIERSKLTACGMCVPGTVDLKNMKIKKIPNLDILDVDIVAKLAKVLNMRVSAVQDSRAAAWAEYKCGAGLLKNSVVCITLGSGVGTGIVYDGKIFNGSLGTAGEVGHFPVVENGRACGCGKCGCLEKYCAGIGLNITAEEILGEHKNAYDLFDAAKCGNKEAVEALNKAIVMLGRAVVFVVNFFSPDCILFSGGLSNETTAYINPIIDYVKTHCYNAGQIPYLGKAALGEYAPLIGAALLV